MSKKKKKKSDDTPVTEMNTVYTNEMTGMVPANPDENDEDYAEDEGLQRTGLFAVIVHAEERDEAEAVIVDVFISVLYF